MVVVLYKITTEMEVWMNIESSNVEGEVGGEFVLDKEPYEGFNFVGWLEFPHPGKVTLFLVLGVKGTFLDVGVYSGC